MSKLTFAGIGRDEHGSSLRISNRKQIAPLKPFEPLVMRLLRQDLRLRPRSNLAQL